MVFYSTDRQLQKKIRKLEKQLNLASYDEFYDTIHVRNRIPTVIVLPIGVLTKKNENISEPYQEPDITTQTLTEYLRGDA